MLKKDLNNKKEYFSFLMKIKKESILTKRKNDIGAKNGNAARERNRVRTLRTAYLQLQSSLPSIPPDTKLSKLDVLTLATAYITHLMHALEINQIKEFNTKKYYCGAKAKVLVQEQYCKSKKNDQKETLHPIKKWPLRSKFLKEFNEGVQHN